MMLQRAVRCLSWGAVAGALLACHDTNGVPTHQGPLAGLRYVNLVSDTGALDIRIVDIVGDAPATFGATFRTGGSPIGTAAQTSPPYQAVAAGLRHIRVFNSSTDPAIAQQVHVDTTFTFEADQNYDFILNGFSRPGHVPARQAMIAPTPPPPTVGPGQFAMRVVNFAPSWAGATPALTDTTVRPDAFFLLGNGALPAGTPHAVDVGYLASSGYTVLSTGSYRLALTVTGTTGPAMVQVHVPLGQAATPAEGPIAGSLAEGSVLTAVIVPRSVVGSAAPQGGTPAAKATESITRSNDTVTVQSGTRTVRANRPDTTVTDTVISNGGKDTVITQRPVRSRPDSVLATTGTATGTAPGDIVLVTDATELEYNGWQGVLAAADSLSCNPVDAGDTATKCKRTNAIATTRLRFTYRTASTPASPATGTPVYRVYTRSSAQDFTIPSVLYLVDRRP